MNTKQAYIFDVGGTLFNVYNLDLEKGIKYLYDEVFEVKSDYISFLEGVNEINHAFFDSQVVNIEVSFHSYFNYLAFIYPLKTDDAFETIEKKFATAMCGISEIPEVKHFLDYLVRQNVDLYVLSNSMFSSAEIKRELAVYGLDSYFKEIVSSADYLFKKPSIDIFQMYYKKLRLEGVMTKNITYVGNTLELDILPAVKLKINALYYGKKNKAHKGYLEFNDYDELIKMLEAGPNK